MSSEQIDRMDRVPPSDLDAERYTLACCLSMPSVLTEVTEIVLPQDFYRPAHGDLFRHMILLWAAGDPVTLVTLRDAVLSDPDVAAGTAGLIPDLVGLPVAGVQGPAHARVVWNRAVRRRMIETGTRLTQLGYQLDFDPAENLARAQKELQAVAHEAGAGDAGRLMSSEEFMRLDSIAVSPVIEGLLWHEERVIIVGVEGDGKTTLGMQVGYCAAAGLHPFWPAQAIPPVRVLILDLEVPRFELQQRVQFFTRLAEQSPRWNSQNLTIMSRPDGIDLSSARDRFFLAERIRRVSPDLIVGGPLYKMVIEKGDGSEQTHSQVTRFWDQIRGRHSCALWFETHPPMQQAGMKTRVMRPMGSGLYSRWPEFGINLMAGTKQQPPGTRILEGYRRHRDRGRVWPERLHPSVLPGANWPWEAVWPDGVVLAAQP